MSARYEPGDAIIAAWVQEPIRLPEDGVTIVDELVHETPQQRRPWPAFRSRRLQRMFSAPRVALAVVVLALVSTGLFAGYGLPIRDPQPLPALVTDPTTEPTALVLDAAEPTPEPTAARAVEPTATPATDWVPEVIEPDPTKSFYWPARSVVLEGDSIKVSFDDVTLGMGGRPEQIWSWVTEDERYFGVSWSHNKVGATMRMSFESDESEYWLSKVRVSGGGRGEDGYAKWHGKRLVTPLGEPMEGTLRLKARDGDTVVSLLIKEMRVHAFHPGSGPAPLTGCVAPEPLSAQAKEALRGQLLDQMTAHIDDDRAALRKRAKAAGRTVPQQRSYERRQIRLDLDRRYDSFTWISPPLTRPGTYPSEVELLLDEWDEPQHQFAGTDIWTMPLADVESLLRDAGVCFEFSLSYPQIVAGAQGSRRYTSANERWCVAPPSGVVTGLSYGEDVLTLSVHDHVPQHWRDSPPSGWGCPANG